MEVLSTNPLRYRIKGHHNLIGGRVAASGLCINHFDDFKKNQIITVPTIT